MAYKSFVYVYGVNQNIYKRVKELYFMKKRFDWMFLVAFIWIVVFNLIILSKAYVKYVINDGTIVMRDFITGAVVYYPATNEFIITKFFLPLIIYNILIVTFLSLSYHYKNRTNKKRWVWQEKVKQVWNFY